MWSWRQIHRQLSFQQTALVHDVLRLAQRTLNGTRFTHVHVDGDADIGLHTLSQLLRRLDEHTLLIYQRFNVHGHRIQMSVARHFEYVVRRELWHSQNELFELGYAPRMHALVRGDEDRHDWMATKYLEFRQIGVGSGVYSIFPDEFSLRARDVPRYVDESERTEGLIADDTCFALDEAEVCARRLIMGARSFEWFAVPSIPQEGVAPEKRAMYESLMTRLDSLVDCGLFERRGDEVRATPQAYAITNEISSYLSPTSYR